MNKSVKIPGPGDMSGTAVGPGHHPGDHKSLGGRVVGVIPWVMIAGLLYAGLFIHPKPTGGAVVPPTIERRDLLFGVTVSDRGVIWVDGNFGKIIKSTDGGKTWIRQESGVDAHLQDIDHWDEQHAVAVGNKATVLRTEDGGAHWSKIEVPHSDVANKLVRVRVTAPGEAWAVGEYGAVLRTADYGASWTVMRKPEDVNMSDIDASNPKNIWIAAESGRLFHSTDGGATWNVVQSESPSSLTAIQFRDADNGVAVGLDGTFLHTENGGADWKLIPTSTTGNVQHLFAVIWDAQNKEWVAVGAKGVWVRAGADLAKFTTGRLSASDLAAHTKIGLIDQTHMLIAGEHPGLWDRSTWTSLIGR